MLGLPDDFRIVTLDVSARGEDRTVAVLVEFLGVPIWLECFRKDIDPPEYVRLKRVAAQWRAADLEGHLADMKAAVEDLESGVTKFEVKDIERRVARWRSLADPSEEVLVKEVPPCFEC